MTHGFEHIEEKPFPFDTTPNNKNNRDSAKTHVIMEGNDYNRIVKKLIFSLRKVNNYSFSSASESIEDSDKRNEKF